MLLECRAAQMPRSKYNQTYFTSGKDGPAFYVVREKECVFKEFEESCVTLKRELHFSSVWRTEVWRRLTAQQQQQKKGKLTPSRCRPPHLTYLTICWEARAYQSVNQPSRCIDGWWVGVHPRSREQSGMGAQVWSSHALFPPVRPPDPDTCLNVRAAAYRHVPPPPQRSEHPFPTVSSSSSSSSSTGPPPPPVLFVFSSAQWAHCQNNMRKMGWRGGQDQSSLPEWARDRQSAPGKQEGYTSPTHWQTSPSCFYIVPPLRFY